jgi:hypothetical protein
VHAAGSADRLLLNNNNNNNMSDSQMTQETNVINTSDGARRK